MKGTVAGTTTTYIGNTFEWTGSTSTMKKYYYAGTTRVAMRTGSGTETTGVNWLFGDHLGSQSITADVSGSKTAEIRFKAWGEDRYTWGTTPTSYRYTGQRKETSISIAFYGARWYDSSLGRFLSPDTIVPESSQGVQAWDRMAYANNNPVRYNDPSGHCIGPFAIVCVVAGAVLLAGLIPGDSRYYEPPSGTDPVLQGLIGLTLFSGGGGALALGKYLMQDGDPTNEINAATTQPIQLQRGNLAHSILEQDYLNGLPAAERAFVSTETTFTENGIRIRPDTVNHLSGEVVEYKPSTYNSAVLLKQATNQVQNYVNVLNRRYGDFRALEGLPKWCIRLVQDTFGHNPTPLLRTSL